jgi:hypothetical protein
MTYNLKSIITMILLTTGMIFAQNARINSLGNCRIVDDFVRTLYFPAEMNDYGDNIQASAAGTSYYGPILGVKSIGNSVNLGGTWSRNSVMADSFYSRAKRFLDTTFINVDITRMHQIPHVLFGLNFDRFQLGVDVFLELASTRSKSVREVDNATYTIKEVGTIFNVGFQLNPKILIGEKGAISPVIGVGFPRMSGYFESDTSRAVLLEAATDNTSIFGIAGLEFALPFNKLDWRIGLFYNLEKYTFELLEPVKFDSPEYFDNYFSLYTGLMASLPADFLFIAQYDASMALEKTTTEDTITNTTDIATGMPFNQNIGLGIERPTRDLFIFDTFTPRAGLTFNIQRAWDINKTETPASTTTTILRRTSRQISARPTIGLGVSRGVACLDVYLQLGNWSGVFGGPNVFMGTFTLDFGKIGSAESNITRKTPEVAPVKEAEAIEREKDEASPVEQSAEPVQSDE